MSLPHRIVILSFDQANLLDISGPAQIFSSANYSNSANQILYEVIIASEQGGLITTNSGVEINTSSLAQISTQPVHTLIVPGGTVTTEQKFPELSGWISQHHHRFNRIGSVCTGAFITAESGILDQRRAVTHWQFFETFKERYSRIRVERDPIYIKDEHIWSSAGVTAGIDLTIAMVQEDYGRQIALETAQANVVFAKRPGGQNQFSVMMDAQTKDLEGRFDELHHWVFNNLKQPLSVNQLADRMRMSPRNFSRSYSKIVGTSPARSIELTRLEAARRMLENSSSRLDQICRDCGFGNEETMRRAFMRHLGLTAKEYRQRFSG